MISSTLVGLLVVLLQAAPARADEPTPAIHFEPNRLPPESLRSQLFTYGGGLALGSYGAALGASFLYESTDPQSHLLRIPIVGPWMKIGETRLCDQTTTGNAATGTSTEASSCSDATQVIGAIASGVDGLLQVGSLLILAEAIFLKTAPPNSGTVQAGWPRWNVGTLELRPSLSAIPDANTSLSLVGRF